MDDLTQQTVWIHFHFSIKTWLFHPDSNEKSKASLIDKDKN